MSTAARLLIDNLWMAATSVVSASSEVSALPAIATQNPDRTYIWRSVAGVGEAYLDCDLGAVAAVSSFALANIALLGAGPVKLQQLGDGAAPGVAVDVATITGADADTGVAMAFFESQSHRHWRVLFTNPAAVNAAAEAGFIHLGPYEEPTKSVRELAGARTDPSVGNASVDGQRSFTQRSTFAAGALRYRGPVALLETLQSLFRTVGVHTPFFLTLDADRTWQGFLARFAGPLEWALLTDNARGADDWYDVQIPWEEVR